MKKANQKEFLNICGEEIARGTRKKTYLSVPRLYDFTRMNIPVEIIRGKKDGPILFISAAIHGDEINGVEVCKRLLSLKKIQKINGTLIVIPIVNVFGFNSRSRYLPDRRDLNRCFPGSKKGSLGSKLAYIFMEEIVKKSTHGIDIHTGAFHRTNLPQIRCYIRDKKTKKLATDFGIPVVINSNYRDGSLRQAVQDLKIPFLLYEGGEALRFEENAIKVALRGILNVMESLKMIDSHKHSHKKVKPFVAKSSRWVRANSSGILKYKKKLGDHVRKGQVLATISDPFGKHLKKVYSSTTGIIIGANRVPLVNNGDAIFNIATFKKPKLVKSSIFDFEDSTHSPGI